LGYGITPALARALDLPVEQGLLVARVYRDSPAARAGIRGARRELILGNRIILVGGDIIVAIDGQPIEDMEALADYLEEQTRVGQTVTLDIVRGTRRLQIPVELEEMPRRWYR
jgi:putative serine protease PepD